MNRTIRGLAGLLVAFGASACASDPSLDFSTGPTQIQASPEVMFVNQGAREQILVRLTNDINEAVPATFSATNVGSGITVEYDTEYRPDNINPDRELQQPEVMTQHRFYVTANTNVSTTFTLVSGSFTKEIRVRVVPTNVGALSSAEPAIGDPVTITAPGDISFDPANTTVHFDNTGDAVITDITAKSITFIPIPGSVGRATVDHVTADYAQNLGEFSLITTNEINVPAVTNIPLSYNTTTLTGPGTLTVTAGTGYVFEPNVEFSYNTNPATVLSVSGDGSTAVIVAPTNLAGATAVVTNFHLAVLPAVSLIDVGSSVGITTPSAFPQLAGTNAYDGGTPAYNVPAPGGFVVFGDAPTMGEFGTLSGTRGSSWYKLMVTGSGVRDVTGSWGNGSDLDLFLVDEGINAILESAENGGGGPEHFEYDMQDATNYWLGVLLWSGAAPTDFLVVIQ